MSTLEHAIALPSSFSYSVEYLPKPNRVEIVLTNDLAPMSHTLTAFCLPVAEGEIVMAMNQRRGLEIPGGHVEEGETLLEAAQRETLEETGCLVHGIQPIGFLRMISDGPAPENSRYPHPISFQQFFAGIVIEQLPYTINDECGAPVKVSLDYYTDHKRLFAMEALKLFV